MKNIIISVNQSKESAHEVLNRLVKWSLKNDVYVYSMQELQRQDIKYLNKIEMNEFDNTETIAVAFGGDGTMLQTARNIINHGFKLFGINLGSLGFLSEIKQESLESALDSVMQGNYSIENRTLLEVPESEGLIALNDIVMYSGNRQRMLKVMIKVNGNDLSVISADGIIISTPTGSTAYSMSAGGPIVFSDVDCLIITPVCPHMLVQRPLVISDRSQVELMPLSEDAVISADSQIEHTVPVNTSITVRKYGRNLQLIKLSGTRFLDVMREKFHLGKDPRQ